MNPAGTLASGNALPFDIYEVQDYPLHWSVWAGLALAALLLVAGAVYLLRRYLAARKSRLATAKPVDPYEQLLSDMLALQIKSPFTPQAAKDYYFQLSYFLKLGVELTQGLRATDLTTKEVAARLKVAERDSVVSLLQLADMVKFAEREVSAAEALNSKEAAIQLVRVLKPRPVAPLPTDMLAKVE